MAARLSSLIPTPTPHRPPTIRPREILFMMRGASKPGSWDCSNFPTPQCRQQLLSSRRPISRSVPTTVSGLFAEIEPNRTVDLEQVPAQPKSTLPLAVVDPPGWQDHTGQCTRRLYGRPDNGRVRPLFWVHQFKAIDRLINVGCWKTSAGESAWPRIRRRALVVLRPPSQGLGSCPAGTDRPAGNFDDEDPACRSVISTL